tara:strand:+ start:7140 stop:7400 length:261 start_codon:yes stop_codon:yes gene_type:complete
MAFTALFTESIYGCNGNDWKNSNGVVMAFPSQTVLVRPLETGDPTTMAGVTMAAKIQLIQPGLALPSYPQYYTPRTVAQCVTDANA